MLYRNFSGYLKEKYGGKVKKICIDGGFTCPNRDGKCGTGGCVFCAERGAGEHIEAGRSITRQVEDFFASAPSADAYIAYFQNFTNTYASAEVLRERYDAALIDERIVALAIGTRPDCISPQICELIASYKKKVDVWVELGLQTADDETAKIINRGYESSVYLDAAAMLKSYGIDVVTHIMIGLPGEGDAELEKTVEMINAANPCGIKIHSVYVCKGSRLEKMYYRGEYSPISMEDYVRRAAYVLTHINPETVVHRLTGDCPKGMLAAPEWNTEKNTVIKEIVSAMEKEGTYQGFYYKKNK